MNKCDNASVIKWMAKKRGRHSHQQLLVNFGWFLIENAEAHFEVTYETTKNMEVNGADTLSRYSVNSKKFAALKPSWNTRLTKIIERRTWEDFRRDFDRFLR